MRRFLLFSALAVGGLAGALPNSVKAGVLPTAAIGGLPDNGLVSQIYYYHGRYYPYRYRGRYYPYYNHGHYYNNRYYRNGGWHYY